MKKDRAAASARAFLNCPFELVVDMLGLTQDGDWHFWKDSDGNRLTISKNKKALTYPSKSITTSTNDIFHKTKPEVIIKHSYWGILLSGKHNIFIFLGNDGRLRCSYFEDNIWIKNISPLLLGFDIIKYIVSEYLETETRQINLSSISK